MHHSTTELSWTLCKECTYHSAFDKNDGRQSKIDVRCDHTEEVDHQHLLLLDKFLAGSGFDGCIQIVTWLG